MANLTGPQGPAANLADDQVGSPGRDPRALTVAPVGSQPLLPWQCAFAEWIACQDVRPSISQQCQAASKLAQRTVSKRTLARIRRSQRFIEYYQSLQLDAVRAARSMLEERYGSAITAHFEGLEMALGQSDYRAIPHYTVPILDRVAPKRDNTVVATKVEVILSSKQEAALTADPVIEVLPAEIISSD